MKRLNKEYKLDVCNHVVVKYGSINKDNPQVVYVSGKCWVTPNIKMPYRDIIDYVKDEMKKNIKLFLIDGINFDKRFILDFDIAADKFNVGEKKFLSFDFYLRQNEENKKTLKELKAFISGKLSTIVNSLVYQLNENNFDVAKRK